MSGFSRVQLTSAVRLGVVRGEPAALAEAYRVLAQAVINLATRMLSDRNLAEEVLQDTFIELVEKSTQIKDSEAIVGWVKRVAVNHCLMKLRAPWHTRRMSGEADWYLEAQSGETRSEQTDMEWAASVPRLEHALAQLSDDARTVLWLHDVEGYTHKEIGALMGRTSSFSKSQLARAYAKLMRLRTQREHIEQTRRDETQSGTQPGTHSGNKMTKTDQNHAQQQISRHHGPTPCPS